MSQKETLEAITAQFHGLPPAKPITEAIEKFIEDFNPETAIKVGDKFPEFVLPDSTNKQVSSADLLAKGPILITFYRGEWCPYCNIALQYLQRQLDNFLARGVTLVAITPELPDASLSTTEKNSLKFPVLTDRGNTLARKLGIIYNQSSAKDVWNMTGVDIEKHNGDNSCEVPIPATLLVDASGVVRNLYMDPDYRKRMEPELAMEWINAL